MAIRTRVHAGATLTNAAATYLTFNKKLVEGGAIVRNLILCHQGNEAADYSIVLIHIVPVGDAPSTSNCVVEYRMPPNSWSNFPGPWFNDSEAYISALFQSANAPNISLRIAAFERFLA